jgi:hypothetical protein
MLHIVLRACEIRSHIKGTLIEGVWEQDAAETFEPRRDEMIGA